MLQYFRNHHHSMVTYIGLKKKTCKIAFKTFCLGFILFDMADLNTYAFTANLTTRNRWIVMQGFVIFIIVLRLNKRWLQILSCNDRFYSLWHSTYLSHYCAFLIPFASVGPDLLSVVKHFLNRWRRCFFFSSDLAVCVVKRLHEEEPIGELSSECLRCVTNLSST